MRFRCWKPETARRRLLLLLVLGAALGLGTQPLMRGLFPAPASRNFAVASCSSQPAGEPRWGFKIKPGAELKTAVTLWAAARSKPRIELQGDTLHYSGLLRSDGVSQALDLAASSSALRQLRINSSGGDAAAGLRLASWVEAKGIRVEVLGYCLSACANFPLRAAREVTVDGLVGLHGSLSGCWRQLGAWGVLRERGWDDFWHYRQDMAQEAVFDQAHPGLRRLLGVSEMPSRGHPDGRPRDWLLACPASLHADGLPVAPTQHGELAQSLMRLDRLLPDAASMRPAHELRCEIAPLVRQPSTSPDA